MMHVCLLITNKTYDFDHSRHNQCIAVSMYRQRTGLTKSYLLVLSPQMHHLVRQRPHRYFAPQSTLGRTSRSSNASELERLTQLEDKVQQKEQSLMMAGDQVTALELEVAAARDAIMEVDMKLPKLEQEKKLAVASRNFKAAGKASGALKEVQASRTAAEETLERVTGDLDAVRDGMKQSADELADNKATLLEGTQEVDRQRAEALHRSRLLVKRAMRAVKGSGLEVNGTGAPQLVEACTQVLSSDLVVCTAEIDSLCKKHESAAEGWQVAGGEDEGLAGEGLEVAEEEEEDDTAEETGDDRSWETIMLGETPVGGAEDDEVEGEGVQKVDEEEAVLGADAAVETETAVDLDEDEFVGEAGGDVDDLVDVQVDAQIDAQGGAQVEGQSIEASETAGEQQVDGSADGLVGYEQAIAQEDENADAAKTEVDGSVMVAPFGPGVVTTDAPRSGFLGEDMVEVTFPFGVGYVPSTMAPDNRPNVGVGGEEGDAAEYKDVEDDTVGLGAQHADMNTEQPVEEDAQAGGEAGVEVEVEQTAAQEEQLDNTALIGELQERLDELDAAIETSVIEEDFDAADELETQAAAIRANIAALA